MNQLFRIKPLEWVELSANNVIAQTAIGTLQALFNLPENCGLWLDERFTTRWAPSFEEARAAAQAYYEQRMAEGLEPATADDVTTWLEQDHVNAVDCLEASKFIHSLDQEAT